MIVETSPESRFPCQCPRCQFRHWPGACPRCADTSEFDTEWEMRYTEVATVDASALELDKVGVKELDYEV